MISCDAGTENPVLSTTDWLSMRSQGPSPRAAVMLHAPSFAFQAPGGGENQLVQTGRALESLGIPIRLFSPWSDRLERAELLHLFGMSREGLELARVAKRRGVPVVLSPICWFEPRAIWALEPSLTMKVAGLARWGVRRVSRRLRSWRKQLLDLADAILPNSAAEGNQLRQLFDIERHKIHVVPNGVSHHFSQADPDRFHTEIGIQDFVLCVGRIEPRKNTLELIRATGALGVPLCLIGQPPPGFENFAEQCRRAGGSRVTWIEPRDHHDPLLASAYAAARVFALPSWFETPGLAALEAALAGCPVVITPYGSAREYFGEFVNYAHPHRRMEIIQAIKNCWQQGRNSSLPRFVASRYLWPVVAQRTAEIYDEVTSQS